MIAYLLKSTILLFIFYTIYKLLLENEKMFRFNRIYLIIGLIVSVILPLQLISFENKILEKTGFVTLNEVIITNNPQNLKFIANNTAFVYAIYAVYAIVVLLLTVRFISNLYLFYKKIKCHNTKLINNVNVILTDDEILPYSFWNTIFINKEEFENNKISAALLLHEKTHIKQKHTVDVLFIEVLQIIFWFSPLLIFYKKAIKLNHEFLADQAVNEQFKSIKSYQTMLLKFASNKNSISLASTINYTITKKRLLMMSKKVSPIKMVCKISVVTLISVFSVLIFSDKINAQTANNTKKSTKLIVTPIEKQPEFPGGMEAFYKFIGENFKMPSEATKNNVSGKFYLQFVVEKEGALSEIKVLKDLGHGLGSEAIRVLKLSPKWHPGTQNGKTVRVLYSFPITIQTLK